MRFARGAVAAGLTLQRADPQLAAALLTSWLRGSRHAALLTPGHIRFRATRLCERYAVQVASVDLTRAVAAAASPADRTLAAQLRAGMVLTAIDGVPATHARFSDVLEALRAVPGTGRSVALSFAPATSAGAAASDASAASSSAIWWNDAAAFGEELPPPPTPPMHWLLAQQRRRRRIAAALRARAAGNAPPGAGAAAAPPPPSVFMPCPVDPYVTVALFARGAPMLAPGGGGDSGSGAVHDSLLSHLIGGAGDGGAGAGGLGAAEAAAVRAAVEAAAAADLPALFRGWAHTERPHLGSAYIADLKRRSEGAAAAAASAPGGGVVGDAAAPGLAPLLNFISVLQPGAAEAADAAGAPTAMPLVHASDRLVGHRAFVPVPYPGCVIDRWFALNTPAAQQQPAAAARPRASAVLRGALDRESQVRWATGAVEAGARGSEGGTPLTPSASQDAASVCPSVDLDDEGVELATSPPTRRGGAAELAEPLLGRRGGTARYGSSAQPASSPPPDSPPPAVRLRIRWVPLYARRAVLRSTHLKVELGGFGLSVLNQVCAIACVAGV